MKWVTASVLIVVATPDPNAGETATRPQSIGIRRRLNTLLPPEELRRLAHESGMVRRRRKLDPVAMLWTLALGFDAGHSRSLAALRRVYQRVTGTLLAPSSFHARFTPELVRFLHCVLAELIRRQSAGESKAVGLLASFADVVLADGSVIKLHRLLARRFAGTRTNSSPAAAKPHLVLSVMGKGVRRVKLTGESASERRALRVGPWVADRLLIFDLGYFRYQMFDCIERNGDYFLSRLSESANPGVEVGHDHVARGRESRCVGTDPTGDGRCRSATVRPAGSGADREPLTCAACSMDRRDSASSSQFAFATGCVSGTLGTRGERA